MTDDAVEARTGSAVQSVGADSPMSEVMRPCRPNGEAKGHGLFGLRRIFDATFFWNSRCAPVGGSKRMRAAYLRAKAQEYLRLASGLSSHSPSRLQLIHMARAMERRARELETEPIADREQPPGDPQCR